MIHDGCVGCENEDAKENSKRCAGCKNTFLDKYTPKGKEHIGCKGCDNEHKERSNKVCKICQHNAPDKYKAKRVTSLTERDKQGNWSVKGLPWEKLNVGQTITQDMYEKLYGCLFKLMQYEYTGLTPEQVEQLMEDK